MNDRPHYQGGNNKSITNKSKPLLVNYKKKEKYNNLLLLIHLILL